MNFSKYTSTDAATVAATLVVKPAVGLSTDEAKERQKKYGLNSLKESHVRPLEILVRQLKSSFIYLLLAAVVLSFALGEYIDGSMIIAFLVINTSLGFYQEYRSEQTVELLRKYITTRVKIRRDGVIHSYDTKELVPGDIVILEAGDGIPADLRITQDIGLVTNEEPLTGESVPVEKESGVLPAETTEIYQAKNICFSGTTVVTGSGEGVVIAIGADTVIGDIARVVGGTTRESEFEGELKKFSKFILYLVVGTLVSLFIANIILKGWNSDIASLAIFSIALAVSVVPEALPIVMTFSLSRGARKLAENKVIVKRLSAIEDLGSIQVLCSDKTGTLTENKLTVYKTCDTNGNEHSIQPGETHQAVFEANMGGSYLTMKSRNQPVDPFDIALWEALSPNDQAHLASYRYLRDIPFDPVHKKNSALLEKDGETTLVVRGAPETILEASTLLPGDHARILAWMVEEGHAGRRVLAVASKAHSSEVHTNEHDETNLTFIGCISFIDPIKESARKTIQEAAELNVKIKILTGDSKEVAGTVAYGVGLTTSPEDVMSAYDFFALPESEQMAMLERMSVFARVSPDQKYKIIELLQKKYQVGFLGEGINDAPALKIANVAIVVDTASDIARDASDIILLERSLKSIVDGIREGRIIFANTIKYIRSSLSSNFGNFYSIAIASLFIPFLPMLPLQILLVNLLSDFPAIAIASDNVETDELHEPKQYNVRKIIIFGTVLGLVSTVFDFVTFATFYRIGAATLQTHWFMISVLTELVFLYSIRTRKLFFKTIRPGTTLLWLSIVAAAITIGLPFTSVGQLLFSFIRPTISSLSLVIGITVAYFISTEMAKIAYYRFVQPLAATGTPLRSTEIKPVV